MLIIQYYRLPGSLPDHVCAAPRAICGSFVERSAFPTHSSLLFGRVPEIVPQMWEKPVAPYFWHCGDRYQDQIAPPIPSAPILWPSRGLEAPGWAAKGRWKRHDLGPMRPGSPLPAGFVSSVRRFISGRGGKCE